MLHAHMYHMSVPCNVNGHTKYPVAACGTDARVYLKENVSTVRAVEEATRALKEKNDKLGKGYVGFKIYSDSGAKITDLIMVEED